MQNLYFPIELMTALCVYVYGLEKRKMAGVRILTVFLGFAALLAIIGKEYGRAAESGVLMYLATLFMCGMFFVIMILSVWNVFRVHFQEAMYCATCAYLSEHIAYCIRLIVNNVSVKPLAETGSILYFLIHLCVYLISWRLVAKNMIRERHYATSAVQSIGLMICSLSLVIALSVVASYCGFEVLHGIYASICCAFVLYSQVKQQKQLSLQEELAMQRQLWLKHKAQYEMAKETVEIINQKCHDLKYQIEALRKISDHEEQKKAIDSMEESVTIYDSVVNTENEYLNTVLTEKSLLCKKNSITLTCIADGNILGFMDAVDLYTLFGNALDNAMEAVMKLKAEERFINLLLYEKAGLIFIQIENYFQGEIQMEEGLPVTTKTEKAYHGFGVKSIVEIVEKYHGFVTIETENQIFLLRITILVH